MFEFWTGHDFYGCWTQAGRGEGNHKGRHHIINRQQQSLKENFPCPSDFYFMIRLRDIYRKRVKKKRKKKEMLDDGRKRREKSSNAIEAKSRKNQKTGCKSSKQMKRVFHPKFKYR